MNESGVHRWQGISKNKVHSSTISVAVLDEESAVHVKLDPKDLDITTTLGSGKGGQHRNKKETCVVIVHKPTGIRARVQSERSQNANKERALEIVRARIHELESQAVFGDRSANRKGQILTGARSDKRRTVQEQNSQVLDHISGLRMDLEDYLKGHIEKIHKKRA